MPLPDFSQIAPDETWSFAECGPRDTGYITHCYHRYPAKFIPQVAGRLIEAYSRPGDTVLDPFMGSGTTPVEAVVLGRHALGLDINPAAVIAARAKTRPLEPARLDAALKPFLARLDDEAALPDPLLPARQDRLDFWFPREQQTRLGRILVLVEETEDSDVRDFLRCGFSHALKTSSYWLMKSSKPTRDKRKMAEGVREATLALRRHLRKMAKANARFWELVGGGAEVDIRRGDARALPWPDGSVDLVVTSPPYVTSYEYADLHQLTSLWLGDVADLAAPKEQFIGSAAARRRSDAHANSRLARDMTDALREGKPARADEVRQYFLDMELVFAELLRVLRPGGAVCNVIGNTALDGVEIPNAEAHTEIAENLGFHAEDVIKRVIPLKTLPQVRDPNTGKFTSSTAGQKVQAYPEEFIVILRKPE